MPVFEFKCTACDARTEHIVLAGEPMPTVCEACGHELKRTWTASPHISFQGWGFSRTDGLVSDTRGKSYRELKERADRIRDE